MSFIYDYTGNRIDITGGVTATEPMDNDIPVVTLNGTLPTSKEQGEISVTVTYESATLHFSEYATVKVQGDSSTSYPKKNFTIKLYKDSEHAAKSKRQFRDWDKPRNKYVLKANWIDHSHARNIVNARLWSKIERSRSDFGTLPETLRKSNLAVDGFPVKVFNNGNYMGLYTWNLPKDALYGLDDEIDTNAIVQGDKQPYSGALMWRASQITEQWADETHDTMPTVIADGFSTLLNFVYTSSDADFVANFENHFDKMSIIDQFIFLQAAMVLDNIGKNQLFFTYDAVKWYGGMYDMDGTWGLPPWQVATVGWKAYNTVFQNGYTAYADTKITNLLYERVGNLFDAEIVQRYQELRASILSADNINAQFDFFMSNIPPYLYEEDYATTTGGGAFTNIPLKDTNNQDQIRPFVRNRLTYVDSVILGG